MEFEEILNQILNQIIGQVSIFSSSQQLYHLSNYANCVIHGLLNLDGLTFRLEIAPFVHWCFIHNREAETNTLGGWRGHFLNDM